MATWTRSLAVGEEIIDAQHEELFGHVKAFSAAMRDGMPTTGSARALLDFLEVYCFDHFATEAKLMLRLGYPDAAAHQALHQRFASEVARLKPAFDVEEPPPSALAELDALVSGWLLGHMDTADRAFAAYAATRR